MGTVVEGLLCEAFLMRAYWGLGVGLGRGGEGNWWGLK